MLNYEQEAQKDGFRTIVGVDEAGRGPLAGPVVAAAVYLHRKKFTHKIRDSKKLSPLQREKAFHEIFRNANVGIGIMSETVIDSTNILRASHYAMSVAVNRLIMQLTKSKAETKHFSDRVLVLIDGPLFVVDMPYRYKTIVRGDSLSLSIACASIVAKVTRDRILDVYDQIFPNYGFKKHKGYPTKAHRQAIEKYGPSAIHRMTFKHCS